jgi:hypothetical protein
MVELALAPLIEGKTAAEILSLQICDPAIGEGAFLIEIVRVLSAAIGGAKREVAARCLRGVDIDPRAVRTARLAVERFVGASVPELHDHLRVGDALASAAPPRAGAQRFTWPICDALVGNPPYIRQERLGAVKQSLREFASYHGTADLYVYFVELAHRVVRPGGRYCLIIPNKWMSVGYGSALRAFLAQQASLERIVDFEAGLFPDAHAFPCIIAGTVGGGDRGPIYASRSAAPLGDSAKSPSREVPKVVATGDSPRVPKTARQWRAGSVAEALAQRGAPHSRERWRAGPWHIEAVDDQVFVETLIARWPPLGNVIGAPARGLVTGCNRAFVIDSKTRATLGDTSLVRPLLKGRNVKRWRAAPSDRYIIAIDRGVVPPPQLLAHLAKFRDALEPGSGRKPGAYKWYELQDPIGPLAASCAPRLFYQDIQTQPACCLDSKGVFAPDTTVWTLPTGDRFVLAVLNSTLYGWYARRRFPPALHGAVRPKRAYMLSFPLAQPPVDLRAQIDNLVAQQLEAPDPQRDDQLNALIFEAYQLTQRQVGLVQLR